MENINKRTSYHAPTVRVIELMFDVSFCISGEHESFTEEDWEP